MAEKTPPRTGDDQDLTRRDHIPTLSHTRAHADRADTSPDEREFALRDARDALLSGLLPAGKARFMDAYERALTAGRSEDEAIRLAWIEVQEMYADPKDAIPEEVPEHMEERRRPRARGRERDRI